MGDMSSGQHKRKGEDKSWKVTKKKWTQKEDVALISALAELCNSGWKRENGIFRSGYTAALERKLKSKLPNCNIKASPHIESRLKLLKRQRDAITEMQSVDGMKWDKNEKILMCEDDDVWDEWVQTHSDAKGLRNKQFPYYYELQHLFGNRSTRKRINDEFDGDKTLDEDEDEDEDAGEEENENNAIMMVDDSFEEDDRGNHEAFDNADILIEHYKNRKTKRAASNCTILPDHEEANDRSEDSTRMFRSNGENLLTDAIIRTETQQPRASTVKNNGSCEIGELGKIFGTFLEKYQEHLSVLTELIGKETAAEKIAGEKRAKLNEELKKLPNLNLQARLRAASLIVTDRAKVDLFYSLSKEERSGSRRTSSLGLRIMVLKLIPFVGPIFDDIVRHGRRVLDTAFAVGDSYASAAVGPTVLASSA